MASEILCYGIIGDSYDKLDAASICQRIREASGPLSIRVNSPGGFVMDGLTIVAAIRAYREKVTVYVDGLAASMASVVAAAADECIMAEASMLMVHNPWDQAVGDAPELRRTAAHLDRLKQQCIAIFAKRTGLAADTLSAMLDAETWFSAQQAVAAGFADSIVPDLKIAAMADVSAFGFRNTPLALKERQMPDLPDTAQAITAERTRISTIMALGTKHRLPVAMTQDFIERGLPLDQARAAMLDHLAGEGDRHGIGHSTGTASGHQTLDNPDTYSTAVKDALHAKISGRAASGPATEFQGLSVVDMARDYLVRGGERSALRMPADRVISAAMRPTGNSARSWGTALSIGGMHTTSDFPDLVGGAAEKYLVERYRTQESQLKQLGRQRTRENFLAHYGIQMGGFGMLDKVNEAGEYKNKSVNSRKEGYKLDTYGNMFTVSRQMLVNDGLAALADILSVMAAASAETEAQILAAIINAGPSMSDGLSFFHTSHGNIAATAAAPAIASLDAGRLAMRRQRDPDGVGLIDANPKFLVVPVNLQTAAEVLVSTTVAPATAAEVNPFAGKLTPIADPRLTSSTAWFLFADPNVSPALEYAYLNGQATPMTDSEDGWRVDGTEYKVRHDFGAGVVDYRMAYRNPGA